MSEEWRYVVGYEKLYQVSSLGRVRLLDRVVNNHSGFKKKIKGAIKKLTPSKNEYLRVVLYKDNIEKTCYVHRLVAEAFIPNNHNLPVVNHINCNKTDNRLCNIEWCTISDNYMHSYNKGNFIAKRESKLTEHDVINIRSLYKNKEVTQTQLSNQFNVSTTHLSKIINRKRWQNVKVQ